MLKKILMTSALFALINIAYADPAPYVGGSSGIVNNTSSVKIDTFNYHYFGGSYRGVPFNLFIGYGGAFSNCFYLAGELFGTLGTADLTDKNGLKTSYGYGVAVVPGLMLSDHTLAYTRLGILRANFSKPSIMKMGGQFGLGLQTTLTQNIDVRFEYDYVAYGSINDSANSFFSNSNVNPRSDQFTVGIIYKFD